MDVFSPLFFVAIASGVAILLTVLFWAVSRQQFNQLNTTIREQQRQIVELKKQLNQFTSIVEESQARSFVVAENTQQVADSLASLQKQVTAIGEQDPDSRLYQKAADMLKAGASVEEVMLSCDLPDAEVQLLMKIHSS